MLRPSRDWRESMTLSSRDPHFGQRIVSEHSLSHNPLWRQSFRHRRIVIPSQSRGIPWRYLKNFMAGSLDFAQDDVREASSCCYAAAALGAAIFFFDFGFLSSNSKP